MKLLELTRSYYPSVGGFEKSIADRVRIYDALGIDYKIVTTDFSSKLSGEKRLPNVIYLRQFTPYNITPSLFKHLRGNYDVVSINLIGRFYSDVAIQYFFDTPAKIVVTPYSVYHTNRFHFIKRIMQRNIIPHLLNKVDVLVALTEYEKTLWVSEYGVPSHRIAVIPLYVHTSPKPEGVSKINNEKYILYLGRCDGNKRVGLLLEAFLQLTDTDYSLCVTLNPDDIVPALYKKIRHDRRIKLLGYVDEEQKEKLLQYAEAVVFPTSWEAFGYVAFEASQYAKPLLCSDLPVFRELLDSNGVIFFHNTVDSLTVALRKFFLLSEEEKRAMGMANYRRLSNFTFEKAKQQYQTLFERLQTT